MIKGIQSEANEIEATTGEHRRLWSGQKNKYRALKLVFFRLTDISAVAELGGVQHVSFKWAAGLKWKQMLPIKDYRGFEGRCGLQVLGIKLDFLWIK